jgi:hypothetical protein
MGGGVFTASISPGFERDPSVYPVSCHGIFHFTCVTTYDHAALPAQYLLFSLHRCSSRVVTMQQVIRMFSSLAAAGLLPAVLAAPAPQMQYAEATGPVAGVSPPHSYRHWLLRFTVRR